MASPLVECIPNFSEARRPEVVEAILESIQSVNGVKVLDRHSDVDHNRTVITFVGNPEAAAEAAFRGITRAAELIDLNRHSGEHPRIGATDVVPFVPISDISMDECVRLAQRLGQRVAGELGIPVYLYEEAATTPERRNLENIRRGQYEGLKEEIASNPARQPDFGPNRLGSAGATVIGARQPLIAFNVYLTTNNVDIAQKIARAIRHSSGGLRYVKAMGMLVEGQAQVSMNLTHYRQTPIARVVEMIRREATRYGVTIAHSELVGLVPQEALIDAAAWHLQLDGFEADQILERKLYGISTQPSELSFLERLAEGVPTPGGGSAAAHTAAVAAALVAMAARLTLGKKKYAAVEEPMQTLVTHAEQLRAKLTEAVSRDAAAFESYLTAIRLPKDDPAQQEARRQAIRQATLTAAQVPLESAEMALEIMKMALEVCTHGNSNAITDAASGVLLANAALLSAGMNVRINLDGFDDPSLSQPLLQKLSGLEQNAHQIIQTLTATLKERAGLLLPVVQ